MNKLSVVFSVRTQLRRRIGDDRRDADLHPRDVLRLPCGPPFASLSGFCPLRGINPGDENVMEQVHFAKRF